METFISVLLLFVGIILGWVVRTLVKPKEKTQGCHMCGRPLAKFGAAQWKIRGRQMHVCKRCHPYFKGRFNSEPSESSQADQEIDYIEQRVMQRPRPVLHHS